MQVVVQDLLTHYKSAGKGKTIILLHGWADKLETFERLTSELSKSYHVVALDLPGFGQSQMPKTAWDLDNYAKFLTDFLVKLNIMDVYAVIGHSNGGALAIRALAIGNIKSNKLVLLSASGVRNKGGAKRQALKAVTKTGKAMTFWLPKSTKQKLQKKLYGTIGSDLLVAPHMKETFKQTVRQDVQADARKLQLPTLLIYGEADKATSVETIGQRLHELISKSELQIIPDADHFAHQSHSQQVFKYIDGFLK